MGFFGLGRKPWQHPDAKRRMQGILALDDRQQELLARLAESDADAGVRRAAAARVSSAHLLQRLIGHADSGVAQMAAGRLASQALGLCKEGDLATAKSLLAHMKDADQVAEVATHAKEASVRAEAGERLKGLSAVPESVWLRVAVQDPDGASAQMALAQLHRLSDLKQVAKNAKVEAIRSAATARMDALRAELKKPSAERLRQERRKQLQALVDKANHLALSTDWDAAQQAFAALKCQCADIERDTAHGGEDAASQTLVQTLERHAVAFARRQADAVEWERQVTMAEQERTTFLHRLADRLASVQRDERPAIAQAAEAAWTALPSAGPQQAVLERRFRNLLSTSSDSSDDIAVPNLEPSVVEAPAQELCDPEVSSAVDGLLAEAAGLLHSDDARAADARFKELHKLWSTLVDRLGPGDPRRSAFGDHYGAFKRARAQRREEQETLIAQRLEQLTALCVEAEQPAVAEEAPQRLKALRERWKAVGAVPRHRLQAVFERFQAACDQLAGLARQQWEARDWERFANASKAEDIIAKVQALQVADGEPIEPNAMLEQLKQLQALWRDLGLLPRERKDDLWARYKAAQDVVYATLQPHFAERDAEREANFTKKEALLRELVDIVEADQPSSFAPLGNSADDVAASKARLARVKALQEAWKQIGQAPRERWKDQQEQWRRQLDRFFQGRRAQFAHIQEEQEENLAQKRALLSEGETLRERLNAWQEGKLPQLDERKLFDAVRDLQKRWRDAGHVPRAAMEEINAPFRAVCDAVYAALEPWFAQEDEKRSGNLAAKEALLAELEQLLEEEHPEWFKDEVEAIHRRWQDAGPVPRNHMEAINSRYDALRERILGPQAVTRGHR